MTQPTVDLGDWPLGQTHEPIACTWTNTANQNVDVAGMSSITLRIAPQNNPSAGRNGVGAITGKAGNAFNYTFDPADQQLGRFNLQFKGIYPDGTIEWSQVFTINFIPTI